MNNGGHCFRRREHTDEQREVRQCATAIVRCRSADDMLRAGRPDASWGPRARVLSATRPGAALY